MGVKINMLDLFNIFYKNTYLEYRSTNDERLAYALECKRIIWEKFPDIVRNNEIKQSDFIRKVSQVNPYLLSRHELDSMFAQIYDFGRYNTTSMVLKTAVGLLTRATYDFVRNNLNLQAGDTQLVGVYIKVCQLIGLSEDDIELEELFGKTERVEPLLSKDLNEEVEELFKYYCELN